MTTTATTARRRTRPPTAETPAVEPADLSAALISEAERIIGGPLPTVSIDRAALLIRAGARQPQDLADLSDQRVAIAVIAAGRPVRPIVDRPILTASAAAVYELLLEYPPHRGLTSTEILDLLSDRGFRLDASTLRGRVIKELGPYGIENRRNAGYRIPASRRPQKT
ncbi:MAG: hypothetical protein GC162_19575 [Planctomycetes bacterium]|nr:hypothetical protein [Planctomycetota bacterium]